MSWHWPREKGEEELEGMGVWRCGRREVAEWAVGVSEEVGEAAGSIVDEVGFQGVEKNCTWRRTAQSSSSVWRVKGSRLLRSVPVKIVGSINLMYQNRYPTTRLP